MLNKYLKNVATNVAFSLCYASLFVLIGFAAFNDKLDYYIALVDTTVINLNNNVLKEITYNKETKRLINYPSYGEKYGDVVIKSLNVEAPLFFGDSLNILRHGVGHYAGSYFPGEGGTIILAAHNAYNLFGNLYTIEIGEKVEINTNYGSFTYKIYDAKIVKETDINADIVNHDKETLVLYTCYPTNTYGRKTQRFIVYADLVGENYE